MEIVPLTTFEQIEAKLIAFVISHTGSFEAATVFLHMEVGTLRLKRRQYNIMDSPHTYTGPELTQDEMAKAFLASLVSEAGTPPSAPDLEAALRLIKLTLEQPGRPAVTVPLSAVLS